MSKVVTNIIKYYSFFQHSYFTRVTRTSSRCFSNKTSSETLEEPFSDIEDIECNDIKSHENQSKADGKSAIENFVRRVFNLDTFTARQIVSKQKKLLNVSKDVLKTNLRTCLSNGIQRERILQFPTVLAADKLQLKINDLKSLPQNINVLVPLLRCHYNMLQRFTYYDPVNRILTLSIILNTEENEVIEIMSEKPFLLILDLNKMKENAKLLRSYGITSEDLVRDVWVLRYSHDIIRPRLQKAKDNNIEDIKTWMIRCPEIVLESYIKKRSDKKDILGENSYAEYLSDRLECSPEEAQYLISKLPALQSTSISKVKNIIDFLLLRGFKPSQIKRVPKILLHSLETTTKRLNELESRGAVLEHLSILTKSRKQYLQYFETLGSSKNKTQKCRYGDFS